MKSQPLVLEDHVIYGNWSGEHGNQVLIYYHPNGIHCTVFILDGCDYGGGVTAVALQTLDRHTGIVSDVGSVVDDVFSIFD